MNVNEFRNYPTQSYIPAHIAQRATRVYTKVWRKWYEGGKVKITPSYWLTVYIRAGKARLEYQRSLYRSDAVRRLYDGMIVAYQAKWQQIVEIEF